MAKYRLKFTGTAEAQHYPIPVMTAMLMNVVNKLNSIKTLDNEDLSKFNPVLQTTVEYDDDPDLGILVVTIIED